MAKRVLVTGGTGFVGANLVQRLLADGHEVHLLVRSGHNRWRIDDFGSAIRIHICDLCDLECLRPALNAIRADWIFHLAAHGAYPTQTNLQEMIATNVVGTANLMNAALEVGFEAFVNSGSSSEYGFKDHPPREDEPAEPNSDYAATKARATEFCRAVAESRGVHIATLRLYSVFGPWEEPSRLLPRLMTFGLRGALPPLADRDTARDFVYVDDAVEAFILAASRPGSSLGPIFNIGTGRQTTLGDMVEIARRVLAIPALPDWQSMAARRWDTTTWLADNRRATGELGWTPLYDAERGFAEMVRWYQGHPALHRRYQQPGAG